MGILSNIYSTVAKFFRPQEDSGDASKSVATNRLKLVLMQDRTNLTPKILEQMRSELIELLSRYVELDKELLELNFEQEGDQVALMLSIPVIRAKDEEEIEAAIKAHNEALGIEDDDDTDDNDDNDDDEYVEDSSDDNSDSDDNSEEKTEEEIEAEKTDAIAKELQDIPKIIKKKKVSKPEEMVNPFKSEETENLEDVIETPSES